MANATLRRALPDAPGALIGLLDAAQGAIAAPIRSELFGLQRFAQHGRSLALTHRAERAHWRAATFFPRLRSNIRALRAAHRYIGSQAATGYDISPAAEWLLDNFHLIEAQLKEIHDGLPSSYFRSLPMLVDEPLAGLPRVYGVAWAFVAHTDSAFDEDLLVHFLDAYQGNRSLNLSEMWALPTTLRVVLVENLRRLAERVAANKAAREVANRCCDSVESCTTQALDALHGQLTQRGVGRVFLAQVAQRLQFRRAGADARYPAHWHAWLEQVLPDPGAVLAQHSVDQAADNLSVSNAVTSLRTIGDADWTDIIGRTSPLMRVMLTSPMFEAEHTITRDQTLHGIEQVARRTGLDEVAVAHTLLGLMQDAAPDHPPGIEAEHWLRGAGTPVLLRALGVPGSLALRATWAWRALAPRVALPAYVGTVLLGTAGLMAWTLLRHGVGETGSATSTWWMLAGAMLMLFPALEAVIAVVNRLIGESKRPAPLPRLALARGIPAEHRVLVVIPALLTDVAGIDALACQLRQHYLANAEPQAQFALLTDWADAGTAQTATDAPLLGAAVAAVRALNAAHPVLPGEAPRFIVLHRPRRFSESEQRWIGWERKRGKLEQLVQAVAEGSATAFVDLGEMSRLANDARYVVTLDSDTRLPPGRLRELVGVAAHPHNTPRLDAAGCRVVGGYGILQPRLVTPLPAPEDFTFYHWLFAGQCGIDPYSTATSEIYQDVFGHGTFTGKGLLHVGAMHAVLAGRLPEGQVLSHDLLEGELAHCAAVTDITLIEDAPFHADVAASRVHRWTRGDWQLLPFLLPPWRHPLGALGRLKMFDNLRRSLVAPMSLALLLLALGGAVATPWAALALVMAAFAAGPVMSAVAGFSPQRDDMARLHFYRGAAAEMVRAVVAGLWLISQLVQQSLRSLDAIARALYRTAVSRRHLLQWTTAASAQAQATTRLAALLRQHWAAPLAATAMLGTLLAVHTPAPWLSAALCLLWASAPLGIWAVSRRRTAGAAALTPAEQAVLEGIARDTWRFFERCVGGQDHDLPPDNLQTVPYDMVAHRTSPTNIGLYLLSVACAREFGWIGTQTLLARIEATLRTLCTLQRHRGHFLNWYDTQTCAPLLPMYVSSVDSGNLSGHLIAVAQACLELARAPPTGARPQMALAACRARLAPLLAARKHLAPAQRGELRALLADHRATRQSARLDTLLAPADASTTSDRLRAAAATCERLAGEADFGFLYHRKRHLFHIGYRVAEQQLDTSFYDLLASESRLTGLLAIAKGDVPVRHWATLGRPFFAVGTRAGLRSWSGSMFEYLMPTLVLDEPDGSALHDACRTALREQVAFAQALHVPWGISESAYAASDHSLAYQYAAQGVPRLALRRTPPDELVIAPYATALAAQIAPRAALANFARLQALSSRAHYGFVDALDFTASRQTDNTRCTPVYTFMAHHQGMTIVALAQVLLGRPAQRWGMAHAPLQAVASLLHERSPREVSTLAAPPGGLPQQARHERRAAGSQREVLPGAAAVEPTHLLSNGRYSVALRANGAGWSRWGVAGLTRRRDDALRDAHGSFFFLRWDRQVHPVSITQHPAPDPAAQYRSIFHADRVCFDAAWPQLQADVTAWVSPEDDIEFRCVALHNQSDRTLDIELISAFEVTLCDARADEAHPAFSNLFVAAQWQAEQQALVFTRTPRLAGEARLLAAHFLAETDPQVVGLCVQTDRQRWRGRNHPASRPRADLDAAPSVSQGTSELVTGLDPQCALSVRLRIAPQSKAQLTFATAASDHADTLHAVVDKYRQPSHVRRASLMSSTLAGIRRRELRVSVEAFAAIQSLTTALVLSLTRPQAGIDADGAAPAVCDRRLLWRFGISGDRPILLVQAEVTSSLGLLRTLTQALRLWSWGGVECDLVVVNAEPTSYQMPLQREIALLREQHGTDTAADARPLGVATTALHLLRAEELSADELGTLQALARVRFNADGRPLLHHVQEWSAGHDLASELRQGLSTTAVALAPGMPGAPPAPAGRFDAASGAFDFEVGAQLRPARPWINVLANASFGAQVSESGGGYTWALNSRMHQLTGWSNDPVADPPSEWFLLQDLRTMQAWSVAPSAWGDAGVTYEVSHRQGSTVIRHRRGELQITAEWCVDADAPVKQVRLEVVNVGARKAKLRVIGIAEWVMGAQRSDRATTHTALLRQRLPDLGRAPAVQRKLTALLCTQRERAGGFGGSTAFFGLARPAGETEDWTCDRRECFDARGRLVLPDHFGQQQGDGLDPCAALATRLELAAGDAATCVFLLGHAADPQAARHLAAVAAATPPDERLQRALGRWDTLLGACSVLTPDPLFDVMVNRWLLYQAVACRLWAKAGFYQAGGATGFRDQLQDAMALAWAAPQMLRDQIVLCASRQFAQGDVQHWWHAPGGAGVRTHFSDDLLWLPHACAHYLRHTDDRALLDVRVPFIEGPPIAEGAEDAYYTPTVSAQDASVYEHAARAIDHSLRVGVHGLPLMGSGDWNDGMNRVGHEGRGESVWLGWFLCKLVAEFAPVARERGDTVRARRWEDAAHGWAAALNGPGWDGQWYRRAFFDDGSALGSQANGEARIDLIAQAWAVFSGVAPPALQRMALAAVQSHLVDREHGLIRLLDPPLAHALPSAGYIQAYPGGVRENGGQYSHAGVWALMAQAQASSAGVSPDSGDLAYRMFGWLSPAHRTADPAQGAVYGLEPYVMAGDVYSQPPYAGRGGWSWYTGAAAWMHRAAIESIFGLQWGAQELSFRPCLPSHWDRAELTLRRDGRTMRFMLRRAGAVGIAAADTPAQATLLPPGQTLRWTALEGDSCFVIPLELAQDRALAA